MKDGQCPMCKSTEVYVNETHTMGLMLEGARNRADAVGINCSVYICKDCNFIALYTTGRLRPYRRYWMEKGIVNTLL
jgi:hypothetical protein